MIECEYIEVLRSEINTFLKDISQEGWRVVSHTNHETHISLIIERPKRREALWKGVPISELTPEQADELGAWINNNHYDKQILSVFETIPERSINDNAKN